METILGWVNLAAAALLAVGCLMLFVDGRGKRQAWNGVLGRVAAVELLAVEYGRRLTTLEHSFARPPEPAPSPVSLRHLSPPAADRVIPARLDAIGSAIAKIGQRMTALEAIAKPAPPVDVEGDREGSPPPESGAVPSTKPAASREHPSPVRGIHDDPMLSSSEDGPSSAEIAAAYHREADERDARHAAPPGDDDATMRRGRTLPDLPRAEDEGDRTTDEEGTRVYKRELGLTSAKRRPPHAPPRRTLLDGLAGAKIERLTSSDARPARRRPARTDEPSWVEKRAAQLGGGEAARSKAEQEGKEANASPGARRDRDTLTPTDPSVPVLDARIQRRWAEMVAEAHEAGHAAGHCQGTLCMERGEGISLCTCRCDGCSELLALLVEAERIVRGE